ncbi:MAG: YmdB family metallophosphoesterase [Puniceicoccaceae bacterium]|nr:MAG: YmdB family metallophosphoesterase [Puniceicoccaceae bacterium]
MLRVLFLGDVVGRPGRTVLKEGLPGLRQSLAIDLVVANAENAAAGAGLTAALAHEILAAGVDGITLGDHVWDQRGFEKEIAGLERVCRPANLDPACPGRTHLVLEAGGIRVGVFTVLGRQFLPPRDCPFRRAEILAGELKKGTDLVVVEIHAEATSEKIALGRFLDGKVAAVLGTHTHIPTIDACLLPGGTAYQTDIGMTGPYDSILGREVAPVVDRFLDGMPRRFGVASGDVRLGGALLELDPAVGRAASIRHLWLRADDDGRFAGEAGPPVKPM